MQVPAQEVSVHPEAQYIDYLFVGGANGKTKMLEGVVPRSTVIANPYAGYKFQIFLPDVRLRELVVSAVVTVITAAFLTVVLVLMSNERKEDKIERDIVGKGFV